MSSEEPSPGSSLQWGRAWLSAESGSYAVGKQGYAAASMGPRLVERGKASVGVRRAAKSAASMGPRLVERGKPKTPRGSWARSSGFNGAALGRARKGRKHADPGSCYGRLQWGRAWLSAESSHLELVGKLVAVASMGPRLVERGKQSDRESVPCHQRPLQWGRAWLSAESYSFASLPSGGAPLQWGRAG